MAAAQASKAEPVVTAPTDGSATWEITMPACNASKAFQTFRDVDGAPDALWACTFVSNACPRRELRIADIIKNSCGAVSIEQELHTQSTQRTLQICSMHASHHAASAQSCVSLLGYPPLPVKDFTGKRRGRQPARAQSSRLSEAATSSGIEADVAAGTLPPRGVHQVHQVCYAVLMQHPDNTHVSVNPSIIIQIDLLT